ncbi:MAG: CHAT domain-containing protein [Planctomycetes bacterium]|nr:CHAT domain-containing protein [Planctomycetota bacterium]MCC7170944.1 CHAT domain-containing protein [Planctomycetota bacterium]
MRMVARVLTLVCALVAGAGARQQPALDASALDRIAAAFERGDVQYAERALDAIPAPTAPDSNAPTDALALRHAALRLRAALVRGRLDEAAALDAALANSPPDAAFADELAFARAEYHRLRPRVDDDDELRALAAAEALYGESLRSVTPARRAVRLEWRGNVRTRLLAVHAADADLREAESIYRDLCDARGAARCLRRRATNFAAAGEPGLALGILDQHQSELERLAEPSLLPELRDSVHLAAVLAVRCDDLDRAESVFERQRALDAGLQAGLTLNDMFLWSERAQRMQSDLVLELARFAEREPRLAPRALALAETVVDHLQATALSTALRRSNNARGDAGPTPRAAGGADVAQLRLFRAAPQDAPAELVLMFRCGERLAFRSLGRADAVEAEADVFVDRWFTAKGLRGAPNDYAQDAHALFLKLCGPAAAVFRSSAPPRLVLLVNGPLEDVPFEALVTAPSAATSFSSLPYVVRTTSVVRIPAISTLRALPAPNEYDRAVAVLDPDLDDPRLPRLTHARAEADALCAAHRECVVLEGGLATLPRLQAALRRAPSGWLHLACHAEWTRSDHDRAVLRLAPGGGMDGRLDLGRVVGIDDPLPLTPGVRVVLSGCGTALGPLQPGEGMLGLWRAFLYRGAACVISTLRPVDDRAAAAWMGAFHRHAARLPAADAARAASLDWLDGRVKPKFPRGFAAKDTAHPQLWAIAIVVGNDGGALP